MKWRVHGWLLLVISLFLVTGLLTACAQSAPPGPDQPGDEENTPPQEITAIGALTDVNFAFAIANQDGDQLLIAQPSGDAATIDDFDLAINGGEQLAIGYLGRQLENEQNSNRETADNFANMPGYLYGVNSGAAVANQTYLLCTASDGLPDSLLKRVETVGLTTDEKVRIAEQKQRGVQSAATLASFEDGTEVLFVLFEPDGANLLFSIVIKTDDSLDFYDYPAVLASNSAWRVDDGGVADPAWFNVLLGVNTQQGRGFIINWIGAEGENTVYLLDQEGVISEAQLYYRYWSPA
ncbi:MAG: hypothetical protein GX572_05895 [Clostridia bacterium]|nr:hypothetical protein [Clostridia bacterium]